MNDSKEINDTETNPLLADTDKDGLNDGVETNTISFVSANDTGYPNNADTDGDNFSVDMKLMLTVIQMMPKIYLNYQKDFQWQC